MPEPNLSTEVKGRRHLFLSRKDGAGKPEISRSILFLITVGIMLNPQCGLLRRNSKYLRQKCCCGYLWKTAARARLNDVIAASCELWKYRSYSFSRHLCLPPNAVIVFIWRHLKLWDRIFSPKSLIIKLLLLKFLKYYATFDKMLSHY